MFTNAVLVYSWMTEDHEVNITALSKWYHNSKCDVAVSAYLVWIATKLYTEKPSNPVEFHNLLWKMLFPNICNF